MKTPVADGAILAAAARASRYGTRLFSYNDLCEELGLVRGKGPRWNNRQKIIPGSRVSRLLTANGYAICKEYASRASTRRYRMVQPDGTTAGGAAWLTVYHSGQ
ncbi:MAG: hypothetical protein O0X96_06810 [Methanocorpusculum sp.]|nr:hypothetical protein [Methanocorpusculum sp.]